MQFAFPAGPAWSLLRAGASGTALDVALHDIQDVYGCTRFTFSPPEGGRAWSGQAQRLLLRAGHDAAWLLNHLDRGRHRTRIGPRRSLPHVVTGSEC